ncbi:MAG: DUF4249 domain-containing protein [Flexibacteraceae bacterium]
MLGCNFQSNVEVELPPYTNKLAVEGYVEPGKPIRVLVTETKSFFDPIGIPEIKDATVIISENGKPDTLKYGYTTANDKIWNFYTDKIADTTSGNTYTIKVLDAQGRLITATDIMQKKPQIISYNYDINEANFVSMKIVLAPTREPSYYRVLYHNDSIIGDPVQSYLFEDFNRINPKTGNIEITTPYRWRKGEVCIVRIFRLSKAYYNFLNSVEQAKSINGNPFVQPTQVISNINNGFGIFATIRYEQLKFSFQ